MRIHSIYIKKFRNLHDVNVSFDQQEPFTVLLGQNATGKSNFLEAIIQIFKFLDLERPHPDKEFEYEISYECRKKVIDIICSSSKYTFTVNGNSVSGKDFFKNKKHYLPKHVFTYYSGLSNKLKDNFTEHLKRYYLTIIAPQAERLDIKDIRRLFYAENIHSNFVLLAFYSFSQIENQLRNFLLEVLNIEDFRSALFVLRKPVWARANANSSTFWGAKGLVKEFLESLFKNSLAPISNSENIEVSYKSAEKQDRLYLYISNKEKLQKLAASWGTLIPFFNALESTYISDLVEDIRVRVKKKSFEKEISYRELSEGEQQLLAVMGLLRFTKDEEAIILLDEPDTHLNPIWKWKYMDFLNTVIGEEEKTHIILTTHDPLVIGGLKKGQIRIFDMHANNTISISVPDIDPKGLGVAGILTSDLFGLTTILDEDTQKKLNEKRHLQVLFKENKLDIVGQQKLHNLEVELEGYGFSKYQRDPLYQRFIEAISKVPELQAPPSNHTEREAQDNLMIDILGSILQEQKEAEKE